MYFKNVTNYPLACNHSFRTIIGLSCKYLIRGLGEWGGWRAWLPEASWLLLSPETQGSPVSVAEGGGKFSGCVRGSGALASWTELGPASVHTPGILKLPSLMEPTAPAPPPISVPSRMCSFQLKWFTDVSPAPHFPFLPKWAGLLGFCPDYKNIFSPLSAAESRWDRQTPRGIHFPGSHLTPLIPYTPHTQNFLHRCLEGQEWCFVCSGFKKAPFSSQIRFRVPTFLCHLGGSILCSPTHVGRAELCWLHQVRQ